MIIFFQIFMLPKTENMHTHINTWYWLLAGSVSGLCCALILIYMLFKINISDASNSHQIGVKFLFIISIDYAAICVSAFAQEYLSRSIEPNVLIGLVFVFAAICFNIISLLTFRYKLANFT